MENSNSWTADEGSPIPLGVTWLVEEQAYNFALYAPHATRVTVLLYSEKDLLYPVYEQPLDCLVHKSGGIWHIRRIFALP